MSNILRTLFEFTPKEEKPDFSLEKPASSQFDGYDENFKISSYIKRNEDYIKQRFNVPLNNDIIIRHVTLKGERKAILVFIDGMVATLNVSEDIIKTLQTIPLITEEMIFTNPDATVTKLISHAPARASDDINEIIDEINFGGCGVFIDGIKMGFMMDTKGWEHRLINKPENEQSVYGPQEAFSEMLRTNSALVRKIIKNEKLICEGVAVGKVTKTRGVIMYISDTANPELVDEVRRRINAIQENYIIASEEVAQLVQDKRNFLSTQLMTTERPDRVARALSEGRVALILNGSPRAIVFPTNVFELTHTPSDAYMNPTFANMTRLIRLIAMGFSLLLPGFYLAMTLFHQEMIPTYLLYSISAARENVPFPSIIEMLLMNFAFEMIREAGIRMPSPIGSTLGIVGGLILGQAAVSAKIVSPLMIIVIAITGIGSFATADYTLNWSYRVLRLVFILLGAFWGFYGIAVGIFIYSVLLGAQKSFGVPYLAPLPSGGWNKVSKTLFVTSAKKRDKKPDFLKTK